LSKHPIYPFVALVGQDQMKLGLILNVINPRLGGVLIRGEKGTGKSTAVRALAEILPEIEIAGHSSFRLSPRETADPTWAHLISETDSGRIETHNVSVVELPVGATEDRVVGTLDLETALKQGVKRFEPGLLAAAHRGILYVDEVNLLDDHVVDVLLDSAAMGICTVEREGVSFSHPARFTLVGTMNPEEGELRPQLLDRFGLCVHVEGIRDQDLRVRVMERRAAYEDDPAGFSEKWRPESEAISRRIVEAHSRLIDVSASRDIMIHIAEYCLQAGVDGHRADIIGLKTAKTLAAWNGCLEVTDRDVELAMELVLPHRIRRQPFDEMARAASGMAAR
jgi:magnesium chelatase subunit I